jgi:hypothetical protein
MESLTSPAAAEVVSGTACTQLFAPPDLGDFPCADVVNHGERAKQLIIESRRSLRRSRILFSAGTSSASRNSP